MNPAVIVPLAFFALVAIIVVGLPIAKARARSIERTPPQPGPLNADLVTRLDRLEQAVEAVATEVERITEGQRFVTRLLSDTPRPGLIPAVVPDATRVAPPPRPVEGPNTLAPPASPADGTVLTESARRRPE